METKHVIIIALIALVLAGGAFAGGVYYQKSNQSSTATVSGKAGTPGDMPAGGPMGQLSEEEQAKIADMTDEERQAYFQEKMGGRAGRTGGPGGPAGGFITADVIEVADDTITVKLESGSSQTYYTDDETTIGYVKGAAELAAGSKIDIFAEPETDGVTTIKAMIVH